MQFDAWLSAAFEEARQGIERDSDRAMERYR